MRNTSSEESPVRVVVASCFSYRDAWEPFAELVKIFWKDFPKEWEFVLAVDEAKGIPWSLGKIIEAGKGTQFSSVVQAALSDFSGTILLCQEDFFLTDPVETPFMKRALSLISGETRCVRVMPCPGPDRDIPEDPNFGEVSNKAPYRVSCQSAFWDPGWLRHLLSLTSTASSFEIEGTLLSRSLPGRVLSVKRGFRPFPYLVTGILRGRWNPDSLKLFRLHEIPVNTSLREVYVE